MTGMGWQCFTSRPDGAPADAPHCFWTAAWGWQCINAFPWPPPPPSAMDLIDDRILGVNKDTTLQDIDDRIRTALRASGYHDSSYYPLPSGFALATRLEQIDAHGAPLQGPERFNLRSPPVGFSIFAYARAVFAARPGYYRVVVFVVTPWSFGSQGDVPSPQDAAVWVASGLSSLPSSIGELKYKSNSTHCAALIYEFTRTVEDADVVFARPAMMSGHEHLVQSGIWKALQQ